MDNRTPCATHVSYAKTAKKATDESEQVETTKTSTVTSAGVPICSGDPSVTHKKQVCASRRLEESDMTLVRRREIYKDSSHKATNLDVASDSHLLKEETHGRSARIGCTNKDVLYSTRSTAMDTPQANQNVRIESLGESPESIPLEGDQSLDLLIDNTKALRFTGDSGSQQSELSDASDTNSRRSSHQPQSGRSTSTGFSSISYNSLLSNATGSSRQSNFGRLPDDQSDDEDSTQALKKPQETDKVKFWACPFYAAQPSHHRECSVATLRTIGIVKQHLYRKHAEPLHYCRQCYKEFQDGAELQLHLHFEVCHRRRANPYAGTMTHAMQKRIKKKERGGCEEEKWKAIFRVLFPDPRVVMPASPYRMDLHEDAAVVAIRDIWLSLLRACKHDALDILREGQGYQLSSSVLIARAIQELDITQGYEPELDRYQTRSTDVGHGPLSEQNANASAEIDFSWDQGQFLDHEFSPGFHI